MDIYDTVLFWFLRKDCELWMSPHKSLEKGGAWLWYTCVKENQYIEQPGPFDSESVSAKYFFKAVYKGMCTDIVTVPWMFYHQKNVPATIEALTLSQLHHRCNIPSDRLGYTPSPLSPPPSSPQIDTSSSLQYSVACMIVIFPDNLLQL